MYEDGIIMEKLHYYSAYYKDRIWRGGGRSLAFPVLQDDIYLASLSRDETKCTSKNRTLLFRTRLNHVCLTPSPGQAVSIYSLKRGLLVADRQYKETLSKQHIFLLRYIVRDIVIQNILSYLCCIFSSSWIFLIK